MWRLFLSINIEAQRPRPGGQVEAPWLVRRGGAHWLFYSGGTGTWDTGYAIGAARSIAGVRGPYHLRVRIIMIRPLD
jgi:beta-xylosidase